MAARRLIYSDALQNDHDINIVLQAFGNLHVDPPSTPTATSIISLTDNDSGSDNESPSIISISDSDSEDLLYHFSHDGDDEDMYWSALRDEDNRAFWAEPDASSSPNPTEGGRVSPPPVESDAVSVEDGESSVMSAGDDDERNYLVSVGRETGVLHSWCVPVSLRNIPFNNHISLPQAPRWPCLPRGSRRASAALGPNRAPARKPRSQGCVCRL